MYNRKVRNIFVIISVMVISFISTYNIVNYFLGSDISSISLYRSLAYENSDSSTYIELTSGVDLVPDSLDEDVMRANTINLQSAIDNVSNSGGGVVLMPAGEFYFTRGGTSMEDEDYVILCRNNVLLVGAGTDESDHDKLTVLKPVQDSSNDIGSLDMFYFNNYRNSNFNENYEYPTLDQVRDVPYYDIDGNRQIDYGKNVYLINADFSNFVIDGENTVCGLYTTNGKGFMINLYAYCDWKNVVCKNTDGSGFGMDCPIYSTLIDCVAINCGKGASIVDGGGSGFGIGQGVSDLESIYIYNCKAINNKKYGFLLEHQSRFNEVDYRSTKSLGFVIDDCTAGGNLYDFGGLQAIDVVYQNVKSISNNASFTYYNNVYNLNETRSPFNFSLYSVRSGIVNSDLSSNIGDVTNYSEFVKWVVDNGYLAPDSSTSFNPSRIITREEAIKTLYRFNNMEGEFSVRNLRHKQEDAYNALVNEGFVDITIPDFTLENDNLDAILWGVNKGIINGSINERGEKVFKANDGCSRAEFFVMLYRMAGSPEVVGDTPFEDVDMNSWYYDAILWGYKMGLTNGRSLTNFCPTDKITKVEVAISLYRYRTLISEDYSIKYNLVENNNNPITYNRNGSISLANPERSGYTFLGWSGSNGKTLEKDLVIPNGTTGNLYYTAHFEANISDVVVNSYPTKTQYRVGESLDIKGLTLKVINSDGTFNYVVFEHTYSRVFTSRGTETIRLIYKGHYINYQITVE